MKLLAPDDVLAGQVVVLRPLRISDLPFLHSLWTDPDTMEAVGGIVDVPENKMLDWFRRMVGPDGRNDSYFLILNGSAEPIGEICFHHFDSDDRSARLNLKVHAKQRGHGYGKDALVTLLEFFFCRVDGRVLTDNVGIKNHPAQSLLLSSGFEIDDSYSDVCMMVMTRDRYLALYKDTNRALDLDGQSGRSH